MKKGTPSGHQIPRTHTSKQTKTRQQTIPGAPPPHAEIKDIYS